MNVVIVGGGIAGLTTALSLNAVGIGARVFETVSRPEPLGVGINLLPHAMRELTELELLGDLRRLGVEIEELVYLTSYGREIWNEPRGLAAGYAWPQIAIHRGELQMLLLQKVRERLGPDAVHFGQTLVDLEPSDVAVRARFVSRSDGSQHEVSADVLVAADGIHSAARHQFYPNEGKPKWNRVTLWRSTTRVPSPSVGRRMIWAGHSRQKFVAYPIRKDPNGTILLNWICDLKADEGDMPGREDWNRKGDPRVLEAAFAGWRWSGVDVPELVRGAEAIFEFPMVDRDPLPRWTHGRATLVGDAAHPMYPIGSNGATQGIIDARAVAYHLASVSDPTLALRLYEAERREATSRLVLLNRSQGPDLVMDLAEARAPTPRDDLEAVLPMAELATIAAEYKKVAGFDPATLNSRASYSWQPAGK